MKFALSTNWCSRRIESGEEIADLALSLGFDELELGFAAQERQIEGFRRRLDSMPVGSVHAFCPVPISAPTASPELYSLASFDEGERALAAMHLKRNIAFAADIGAKTVVLHAGRVGFSGPLRRLDSSLLRSILEQEGANTLSRRHMKALSLAQCRRLRRGRKMLDIFMRELSGLVGELERHDVTLGLENLPYLEGFPDEREMEIVAARFGGSRVKAWFDTGHDRVRQMHGWVKGFAARAAFRAGDFVGMHLNDVEDYGDDHLAPSFGKVDFPALRPLARSVRHIVFEPSQQESEERLRASLGYVRSIWE